MNFFSKLLAPDKPRNQVSAPGEVTFFDGQGNTIEIDLFGDDIGIDVPAFNQAADLITEQLLSLPIEVMGENDEVMEDHPLLQVLDKGLPSFGMTGYDVLKMLYSDLVRKGDAFAIVQRGGADRRELVSFIPALLAENTTTEFVNTQQGNVTRRAPRYSLQRIDEVKERAERYTPEELLHFKGRNFNGLLSFNPSKQAKKMLKPIRAARELIAASLEGGASVRDLIEINNEMLDGLSNTEIKELYTHISKALTVNKSLPKAVGVLPYGTMLRKRDSTGLLDQTLMELEIREIENIARLFNLSARYLGISRNIRVSQELQTQSEDLINITLAPYIRSIEETLDNFVGENEWVKLSTTEAAKGTTQQRAQTAIQLAQARLITRDEAREYVGWPEQPEGEFVELMPGQVANDGQTGEDPAQTEETE